MICVYIDLALPTLTVLIKFLQVLHLVIKAIRWSVSEPLSVSVLFQEQRLLFLKQQEHRQQQTTSEQKKLQHLRDAVEKQEAQLKMVRALKGQVEQKRLSNGKLGEHHSLIIY